jgi:serine/threonine protein kinase
MAEQFPLDGLDRRIIELAQWRFFDRVVHAIKTKDRGLALQAYEEAKKIPTTTTRDSMAAHVHLNLDGPVDGSSLYYAFRGTEPFVVKGLTRAETGRAETLRTLLAHLGIKQFPYVTTFQLLRGGKEYLVDGDPALATDKFFMVMPFYKVWLERVPYLERAEVSKLWKQLSTSLRQMHAHGLAFMDVKPPNICVDNDFVFIDIGSVVPFGYKTESTAQYIPQDIVPTNPQQVPAHPIFDWAMLMAVMSEKCCGPLPAGYKVISGGGNARDIPHLQTRLRAELWDPDRTEDGSSPICNELFTLIESANSTYVSGCAAWKAYVATAAPHVPLAGAVTDTA